MIKKILEKIGILLVILNLVFLSLPVTTFAQTTSRIAPSRSVICGGPCPLVDTDFRADKDSVLSFIVAFARFITFIGVGLAVLFIVWSGIQFIIGRGEDAKKNLISTIIGLVVIIIAYTVVSIIVGLLQGNALGDVLNSGSDGNF
jgi:hypothetical protein